MDITLLLLGFVSFLAIFLLLLFYRHRSQFIGENLPPGNVGYPVIGETLDFYSASQKGQPEKFISDRVNKHNSQIFKTSMIGERVTFFCGAACNKFVFSNENKLVRSWYLDSLSLIIPSSLTVSVEETSKMKRIIHSFLKPDALQRKLEVINQLTQSHFEENWENQNQVHAYELARNHTFNLAVRLFVSLEDQADIEKLRKPFSLVNAGILSLPINFPGTSLNKAIEAAKLIRKDMYKMIKQRKNDQAEGKASPPQDLLSHFLFTCQEDGSFMEESRIVDNIIGTLVGGFDSTSAALTFIVKYLAELPHIYDAVYKGILVHNLQ